MAKLWLRPPRADRDVAMTSVFARLAITVLLAAAASVTLHAQDSRLVTRVYDDSEVVTIEGKIGVQATIGFGEAEQIENVAVGDADKWQITPNKRADLLFVKPLEANARTNMTVVTDKHTYFFDLVASPTAKPVYMLRFSYGAASDAQQDAAAVVEVATKPATIPVAAAPIAVPADAPPAPVTAGLAGAVAPVAVATPAANPAATPGAVSASADPAMLNFAWGRKGAERIGPSRIYDDGVSTYLLWGQGQALPVIMLRGDAGKEVPAEFAIRGNTTVLSGVPNAIILRGGKASLVLENLGKQAPAAVPASAPAPTVAEATAPDRSGTQAN